MDENKNTRRKGINIMEERRFRKDGIEFFISGKWRFQRYTYIFIIYI